MDELVNWVAEKTGLAHEQAQQATQVVLDYLMTKLPAPLAEQIRVALGSGGFVTASFEGAPDNPEVTD